MFLFPTASTAPIKSASSVTLH